MNTHACPICRQTSNWAIQCDIGQEVRGWLRDIGEQIDYRWRLCQRCGNAFPSAKPDIRVLANIWKENRQLDGIDEARAQEMQTYRIAVSRIGAERAFLLYGSLHKGKPGRFLDIACGLGETVHRFQRAGWEAEGIDADPSTKVFHNALGIQTCIGQVEKQEYAAGFDMIQISHAIYFITDPMSFLARVKQLLLPDGIFCVSIADFMASKDRTIPNYAHSFFPTAGSMRYALALAGFETILQRNWSGTIYMAARPAVVSLPRVSSDLIRLGYQTKALRYALLGKPEIVLRQLVKRILRLTQREKRK